jgi:hypothetical protein
VQSAKGIYPIILHSHGTPLRGRLGVDTRSASDGAGVGQGYTATASGTINGGNIDVH